jgi:hypothetical protein
MERRRLNFLVIFSSAFISVHLWFRASVAPRRGLASRTKMAAPPRDDHAADLFPAADAGFPIPLVDAMTELVFAAFPVGIHII